MRRWVQWAVGAVGVVALAIAVAWLTGAIGRPTAVAPTPSPVATEVPSASPSAEASSAPSDAPETIAPTPGATPPPPGWTAVEIVGIESLSGIVERDGYLLATGHAPGGGTAMARSDDGVTWRPVQVSGDFGQGFPHITAVGPLGYVGIVASYAEPMGIPTVAYAFSEDGSVWEEAAPPATCFSGSISAHESGFVGLGGRCRTEGDFGPSDLHVLTSADGREWTTRIDSQVDSGPWATDGSRLVMLEECCSDAVASVWLSDDVGATWRQVTSAFPSGVTVYGLLYGNGRYVADASWLIREGDPDAASCVSTDGETWECRAIPDGEGDMAGRHFLGRPIAVTPTGYVSLVEYFLDQFGPSATEMVLATSLDGLSWSFARDPTLPNKLPSGMKWTSYGIFAWGGTNPNLHPTDVSQPYLDVNRAPLP